MKIFISVITLMWVSLSFANQISVESQGVVFQNAQQHLSYNFGTVWTNTRNRVRFNVTNVGDNLLTFKNSIIYGADFRAFHTCKSGLLPQEKCFFEVEYWPVFEGMSSGRFTLAFFENEQIVLDLWGNARRF
jgi:hypothetical protein